MTTRDFPVDWAEMHRHARALAWKLQPLGPFKGMVAVTRGGMVPACIIARELNIKLIETVCISSYEDKSQRAPEVLKMIDGSGEGWLVVDDLADTGSTFALIRQHLPKAHYAAIYTKPQGRPLVDSWMLEVSQDTWIHFPWELDPPEGGTP